MESSNKIYRYLYTGGDLIKDDDGNVKYKGRKWEEISIDRGMTYHDFVVRVWKKMNIAKRVATFAYTLEFDLFAL